MKIDNIENIDAWFVLRKMGGYDAVMAAFQRKEMHPVSHCIYGMGANHVHDPSLFDKIFIELDKATMADVYAHWEDHEGSWIHHTLGCMNYDSYEKRCEILARFRAHPITRFFVYAPWFVDTSGRLARDYLVQEKAGVSLSKKRWSLVFARTSRRAKTADEFIATLQQFMDKYSVVQPCVSGVTAAMSHLSVVDTQ